MISSVGLFDWITLCVLSSQFLICLIWIEKLLFHWKNYYLEREFRRGISIPTCECASKLCRMLQNIMTYIISQVDEKSYVICSNTHVTFSCVHYTLFSPDILLIKLIESIWKKSRCVLRAGPWYRPKDTLYPIRKHEWCERKV